jgi:chromatin remodeling complex protein RSC6
MLPHKIACDTSAAEIFGHNYPRLQKLKGKYDPTNMFNKTHPISPILGQNGH